MLQKIAVFLLSLCVLLVVLVGYALWFANTDRGREFISQKATANLGREVEYSGHLKLLPQWPLTFQLSGLRVDNMDNGRADDMLNLGTAEVSIRLLPLLLAQVNLPRIYLADSTVALERTSTATNWEFGEPAPKQTENSSSPSRLSIGRLDLRNSKLGYYDEPQQINVNIHARTEGDSVVVVGKGTYLGQAFRLNAEGGELLSARENKPYPFDLRLSVGYTTLVAEGTIQDPMNFSGISAALNLKGADASELFPLFGIALPPTPPYDIHGQLKFANNIWQFNDFRGVMGNSDISGNVTWDQSTERPKLTARFLSQKLDLVDLGPLIGLAPDEPASPQQEEFAEQRQQSPYLIPDVSLDISRLKAMDADVTYKGNTIISPYLPLDDFLLQVQLDNSVLHINPVQFGTADGDVIAHLNVNARQEPVQIDSDFSFSRLSLARLTESINKTLPMTEESEGLIGGTAKLKGQGKSLKEMLSNANGSVGVGMEGGSISNLLVELIGLDVAQGLGFLLTGDQVVPVRCIIGDFTVTDGTMQSQALVIDTADTNIQGNGTINLASEEMNLRIKPQPKDATLAALRVPLRIEGTLKQPDFVIEKAPLLLKGAGAAALGTLLTPVAGLLALVEAGLGENSDCAALVNTMNARTGKTSANDNIPKNTPAAKPEPEASSTEPAKERNSNQKPPMQDNIVEHPGEAHPVNR
jgi:uncharacterized protein involved in outer membrane biogenesis